MARIQFYVAIVLLIGGTIATEFLLGSWSHRSQQADVLAEATQLIDRVPDHFGDWQLQGEEPFKPVVVKTLQCPAYLNRDYVNTRTGVRVSATLIVGPAGPMVAHKPEICFSGREFQQVGETETITIEVDQNQKHQFHVAKFKRLDIEGTRLACYYGWTKAGAWLAPSNPRLSLGGEPALYKVQIVTQEAIFEEDAEAVPSAEQFLAEFIPFLSDNIFSKSPSKE